MIKTSRDSSKPATSALSYTNNELIRRLYGYARHYSRYWSVAIVCMILVSGFTSLQAYLIKPALDEIFIDKNELYFTFLPWVIFGTFFLKGMTQFFYEYYLELIGQSLVRDLRMEIFKQINRQSISFFHKHPTGELMSRILTDVSMIQYAISTAAVGMIKNVLQIIGLVGLIFYLDWKLAIFCTIFIAIAFLPVMISSKIHRRLNTQIQEVYGQLSAIMHESLLGNLIIQSFTMEKFETERFSRVMKEVLRVTVADTKTKKLSSFAMEVLGGIGIVAIIVYGGSQVMRGEASTGTFFSFLAALVMTYDPIKGITRVNSSIQQGFSSADRVFWMLDHQPEIQDRPNALDLLAFAHAVQFDSVGFQYPDTQVPVLKGITLTLQKGQMLALVGHSGSGKTTMANLLSRFLDVNAGEIRIDGQDIRDVTLHSLRQQIAVVTQNTVLFNDTIRNNIAYGQPDCPMEQIIIAARQANALEFIEALPKGFDTWIGESGVRLSGGQRQRLAIARAFMKNAPILVLDEATSSLDTVSERAVQDAIDQLMAGRTVMVIAHRLTTVKRADRIVVIKNGQIAESGTHTTLLAQEESEYRKLYQFQQSHQEEED